MRTPIVEVIPPALGSQCKTDAGDKLLVEAVIPQMPADISRHGCEGL